MAGVDDEDEVFHHCLTCGRIISREEYEVCDGLCYECFKTEIGEREYEDD
ncbi:MAG: hypothetical protein QW717_05620 [Candidatus Bathyarchaeia archaeon]